MQRQRVKIRKCHRQFPRYQSFQPAHSHPENCENTEEYVCSATYFLYAAIWRVIVAFTHPCWLVHWQNDEESKLWNNVQTNCWLWGKRLFHTLATTEITKGDLFDLVEGVSVGGTFLGGGSLEILLFCHLWSLVSQILKVDLYIDILPLNEELPFWAAMLCTFTAKKKTQNKTTGGGNQLMSIFSCGSNHWLSEICTGAERSKWPFAAVC